MKHSDPSLSLRHEQRRLEDHKYMTAQVLCFHGYRGCEHGWYMGAYSAAMENEQHCQFSMLPDHVSPV